MVESSLNIYFVYDASIESIFGELIDYLNHSDEEPDSVTRGAESVTLKGSLMKCTLRTIPSDRHSYAYDADLLQLFVPCDRLVRDGGQELLDDVLGFVSRVHERTTPRYVFGMHSWQIEPIGKHAASPISDEALARNRVDHPTWLMLFSPGMVDEYGRDWLLDLPVDRAHELADGDLLLIATETITTCESDTELAEVVLEAMEPIEEAFDSLER